MPDWRALLHLKKKRNPQQAPKAVPPPTQAAPAASPSMISTEGRQPSPHRPASGSQTQTDKLASGVANGLKLALRLLKKAVTGIGAPGLEAAVSGVVKVIDIIENVRNNDKNLGSLSRRISSVAAAVTNSPNLHPKGKVPEALRLRMAAFLRELEVLLDEVEEILGDRNLALRTANSEANRDAITEINASIDQLISQFTAEGIISLELDVAGARQDVRVVSQKVDDMDQTLGGVKEAQLTQVYEALIQSIPRMKARHNDKSTKPSRSCHRGTRTDLLQGINNWVKGGADDTPYLWLCGEERLKQLGASSFFSRHERDRQDPHLLFPSIAYQLSRFDRRIWRALAEALEPDPDIVNRDLPEQLKKLILEPLSRSGLDPSRTVVIVVDGLDECSDPTSVLDALALGVEDVSVHLRVLVCSRPYAAIQAKFKNTHLYHLASQTHFHDINSETLSNDVAAFLTWSLREIAARPANRHLPTPWPAEDQLAELIDRASGLFIVGSTYTEYIDDPAEDNPDGQLTCILSRKRGVGSSPLAELDALYDQVLEDLKGTLRTAQELIVARGVIELVILAQSAISLTACSGLLSIEPLDVRSILRRLTAVILLPEAEDKAITPFHASFAEYVQDDTRCTVLELSVNNVTAHTRIATRCIASIASAAGDGIIGVEYDEFSMPLHLNYGSMNLATHISSSSDGNVGDGETAMRSGIWTWLNLMFTIRPSLLAIRVAVERAGFQQLLQVEGLDAEAEFDKSIGKLMIAKHALAINSASDISSEISVSATGSAEARRSKGVQIITFPLHDEDVAAAVIDVLKLVREARHWNMHKHPDMFVESVIVDLESSTKVRLLVRSPISLRGLGGLSKYLERKEDLNIMSRACLALEIAKGMYFLHESPYHSEKWLLPDFMLVSAEGKVIFAPGQWIVAEEFAEPEDSGNVDSFMVRGSGFISAHYWYRPEPLMYTSLQGEHFMHVWDFGSILYEIMTTTPALPRYRQLTHDEHAFDDDYSGDSFKDNKRKARFEAAVSLLLDTIEDFEEVKAILKACWAYDPHDRPTMQVVVEQLEAMIQSLGAPP